MADNLLAMVLFWALIYLFLRSEWLAMAVAIPGFVLAALVVRLLLPLRAVGRPGNRSKPG